MKKILLSSVIALALTPSIVSLSTQAIASADTTATTTAPAVTPETSSSLSYFEDFSGPNPVTYGSVISDSDFGTAEEYGRSDATITPSVRTPQHLILANPVNDTFVEGHEYTVSYDYKTEDPDGRNSFVIQIKGGAGNIIPLDSDDYGWFKPTDQWQTASFTFTAAVTAQYATVEFYGQAPSFDTFDVDNVSITSVPNS